MHPSGESCGAWLRQRTITNAQLNIDIDTDHVMTNLSRDPPSHSQTQTKIVTQKLTQMT